MFFLGKLFWSCFVWGCFPACRQEYQQLEPSFIQFIDISGKLLQFHVTKVMEGYENKTIYQSSICNQQFQINFVNVQNFYEVSFLPYAINRRGMQKKEYITNLE